MTLGALLKSAARTEILRVLVEAVDGVALRELARLAGVYPRSAELALAGLERDGLVRRARGGTRVLFSLCRRHEAAPVLEAVFFAASQARRAPGMQVVRARARGLLPFMKEASAMLACARETRHVA